MRSNGPHIFFSDTSRRYQLERGACKKTPEHHIRLPEILYAKRGRTGELKDTLTQWQCIWLAQRVQNPD